MLKISIKIDNQSTYRIDLEEEYSPVEFIDIFENHIAKVKKLSDIPNSSLISKDIIRFETNNLFDALDAKIQKMPGLIHKDHKTMRSYQFEKNVKGGQGFIWLAPRNKSLWVYFKKENFNTFDKEKKTINDGSTWGEYPMMKVHDQKDVKYAYELAESTYKYHQLYSSK
ncbi:MAG: hypothetical protein CVU43_19825 [Chloroflexi bacterium HGW-Chloroflexi-5]|jgi:hypothetical protein|nr:MAG: hypothetical protein CVU54_06045 [Deltaproteobacteria bacterium HGW-Deltaproteobacteria-12]PKN96602.1 MAG: hypothetical protein CVU43_19825 [Chloroflexi bacterium HGW-Chloroflexi-5]